MPIFDVTVNLDGVAATASPGAAAALGGISVTLAGEMAVGYAGKLRGVPRPVPGWGFPALIIPPPPE